MKGLMEQWGEYLNEITSLDANLKQEFLQTILDSKFWTKPHGESKVDISGLKSDRGQELTTPSIEALESALNDAAKSLGTEIIFVFTVTSIPEYVLRPEDPHGGYPNNWLMHGQYMGPHEKGHVIWLEFRPVHDEFDLNQLNAQELAKNISRTINHEMVHYNQLKKQAKSKGLSEEEAWEEMKCDPKQIPVGDPDEYRKRCGKEPPKQGQGRDVYLSRHPEVDAFAHEAAEQLLDKYTPSQALKLIKRRSEKLDGVVRDYLDVLGGEKNTHLLKKFWTKLYLQIQAEIAGI